MAQNLIHIFPLIISAVILIMLATYAWLYREQPASLSFFFAMIALLVWVTGFMAEILTNELEAKIFWANIPFFGITVMPLAWLAMVIDCAGYPKKFKRYVYILGILPITTMIVIYTNPWHHLFRQNPWVDTTSAAFTILVNDYGPWFHWVHVPLNSLLFAVSLVLLLPALKFKASVYRKQILILIISLVLPLTTDFLYVLGYSPIPNFNLTPVVFSFSGILIGWSLLQYQFLDLVPTVRGTLIETMKDGWIVLDNKNRFVDLNPVACSIVGCPSEKIIGQHLETLDKNFPAIRQVLETTADTQMEVNFTHGPTTEVYDLQITLLRNKRGCITGRLFVLRDITVRKRLEEERENLVVSLQDALGQVKTLRGLLPICANCKKIRDDEGYWHKVEVYIEKNSEAQFSHGICPECRKTLYPEFFDRDKPAGQK